MRTKLKRRSADEISRDKQLKESCSKQLAQLIANQWDNIVDAEGDVTLKLTINHEDAVMSAKVSFQKTVEVEAEIDLDEKQSELPGTATG